MAFSTAAFDLASTCDGPMADRHEPQGALGWSRWPSGLIISPPPVAQRDVGQARIQPGASSPTPPVGPATQNRKLHGHSSLRPPSSHAPDRAESGRPGRLPPVRVGSQRERGCRLPSAWDRSEGFSATSMGPPGCQ
jgi:hypothetical protein